MQDWWRTGAGPVEDWCRTSGGPVEDRWRTGGGLAEDQWKASAERQHWCFGAFGTGTGTRGYQQDPLNGTGKVQTELCPVLFAPHPYVGFCFFVILFFFSNMNKDDFIVPSFSLHLELPPASPDIVDNQEVENTKPQQEVEIHKTPQTSQSGQDFVDAYIQESKSEKTKQASEQYVNMYLVQNYGTNSEESLLNFAVYCQVIIVLCEQLV